LKYERMSTPAAGGDTLVAEVLDRWTGADHCYFKVRGEDGNLYILRRDEAGRQWELTMFKTPQGEALIVAPPPKGKPKPKPH